MHSLRQHYFGTSFSIHHFITRFIAHFITLALYCWMAPAFCADNEAQIKTCHALEQLKASSTPADIYRTFNAFCIANYGSRAEPKLRELFGTDLRIVEQSEWSHISSTSACIALSSNLPALSHIEYGIGKSFDQKTTNKERPFSIHIHYLNNLEPDTSYQWRAILIDEYGKRFSSPTARFTTTSRTSHRAFPAEDSQAPYTITQPGHYVLTRDLVCEGTAIIIDADDVVLDLGGHSITYATALREEGYFENKWMSYVHKGSFGIKSIEHKNIHIVNGRIFQGPAENRGNNESTGFNPLYLRGLSDVHLAGLEVDYHTPQVAGIRNRAAGDNYLIHHNMLRDRGCKMHNRHGSGCSSIDFLASKGKNLITHHNLVARTRQNGLRGSPEQSFANEIYVDSWATNSFACSVKGGGELFNNRIFATGYHAIAVPWGNGVHIHDNFIHMQGINTGKRRWWEGFGDQNSMNGLRHTQWGNNKTVSKNSLYDNNTVCIYGRNGAQIRGVEFFSDPYIENLTLQNSYIKVVAQDAETSKAACVATHGNPKREVSQLPVFYRNNTFVSNRNIIRIGDDYGKGSHHHFFNNTFERYAADQAFHTFVAMGTYTSRYHRFVDTLFKAGTAADDIDWTITKPDARNYDIEWTLHITAAPASTVQIRDALGTVVVETQINEQGELKTPLKQYRMSLEQETHYTPHQVLIGDQTFSVTMDQARTLSVP